MGTQLNLFDVEPAAGDAADRSRFVGVEANARAILEMSRRNDAETSRAAAERMVANGKLRDNQAKVLAALVASPGSTYAELARIADLPEPEPARRLPELVRMRMAIGPVDANGKRISRLCTVRGTECGLWWPTAEGMAHAEGEL